MIFFLFFSHYKKIVDVNCVFVPFILFFLYIANRITADRHVSASEMRRCLFCYFLNIHFVREMRQ